MTVLTIQRADGILTVQDMGRPGHVAQGLSRGGAMDRMALIEAAALLGAPAPLPGIEMAGAGGIFTVSVPCRIALTGAPMTAALDDTPLRWNATHLIEPGQRLRLAGMTAGIHGYLVPAGGIATPEWLNSRAAHLAIGIGATLTTGTQLPLAPDPLPDHPPRAITVRQRFSGGIVRIMDGAQTSLFDDAVIADFLQTEFIRAPRGNRQGIQLEARARFASGHAGGLASDMIGPGDVQMTGDGVPYVLMAECQTMGGYPRIGTVIPADLPIVAQAAPGTRLRFQRLSVEQGDALYRNEQQLLAEAAARCETLIRNPADMTDLLSYQLVGGVTAGRELEEK